MRSVRVARARSLRQRQEDEVDSEGSWAVSYGDMVTLLLTFFIVFFTLDPAKKEDGPEALKEALIKNLTKSSANEVYQGMSKVLSMSSASAAGEKKAELQADGRVAKPEAARNIAQAVDEAIKQAMSLGTNQGAAFAASEGAPQTAGKTSGPAANQGAAEGENKGASTQLSVGKDETRGLDREVVKQWGGVVHDRGDHIIVEFPGISFFNSGRTELTANGQQALQRFVKVYMPYAGGYTVSIRAFADHRQVKRTKNRKFDDNLELTALRSVSAMRTLRGAGVPLSRIKVGGYGELLLTAHDLESIPLEKRGPASALDLARKIVLVVEPEAKP